MSEKRKTVRKVVLLGDAGVGKTSLIYRYAKKIHNQNYTATIGEDFLMKNVVFDETEVVLNIWDTAGQERFHGLGTAFFRGADCCVLVFDVSDPNTFRSIDQWKSDFLRLAAVQNPESFPFVLLGNKIELENRMVSSILAKWWCKSNNGIPYFDTSAKNNINVQEAFQTIARLAYAHKEVEENYLLDKSINLSMMTMIKPCCF